MTIAQLIPIALDLSMGLIVFTLGLSAGWKDAFFLFRRPGLLVRSLASMNIVMLAFAVGVAVVFALPAPIEIALVALALSPVPPILPAKQRKAGGSERYTMGLFTAAALVAIVLVPVTLALLGALFGLHMRMPIDKVAWISLKTILLPLALGILLHQVAPAIAAKIARPVSIFAAVLLIVAFLPILFTSWRAVWALVGNGLVVFLVLFTGIGLLVGHLLGGPDPDNRTVLALATATRHPAVALAIASINFPEEKAVVVVVIYHLLLGAIVSVPYVNWRKREHASGIVRAA